MTGSEELKQLFNRFDIETVIKVDNKAQKMEELETILKDMDFGYSKVFFIQQTGHIIEQDSTKAKKVFFNRKCFLFMYKNIKG
ncbi:hypothetical protein ACP8HI_20010 [Paenibacillus sp. FA6]|uniref:hypothetical protein n=1 Tax=Paenibacillus sp. FA6 TaxID=3413029 RepID=UPI003F65ADE7